MAGQAAFPTPPAAKSQVVHKAQDRPEPQAALFPVLPVPSSTPTLTMAEPSNCPRCAREQPRARGEMEVGETASMQGWHVHLHLASLTV